MKYYELKITILLKKDIHTKDIGQQLSKHINYTMLKSDHLKALHVENQPKLYCYDYLYPLEKDRMYKAEKVYVFRLRTPNEKIASEMRRVLSFCESYTMKPLGCDLRSKNFRSVEELYTITPVIATVENRNWTIGDNIDLLWQRIDNNLEKKYKLVFDEEIQIVGSAVEMLELKNKKPVVMNYKNGVVLGNKCSLIFKPDEISQKLAYIALSCGMLEKTSSLGAGFCKIGKKR